MKVKLFKFGNADYPWRVVLSMSVEEVYSANYRTYTDAAWAVRVALRDGWFMGYRQQLTIWNPR